MAAVTRNTIWFDSGDIPYVDFEVKGVQLFFNFRKSLSLCLPTKGKKAMIKMGVLGATNDDVDLHVPEWAFWFIADDTIEMSCYHNGAIGNLFSFRNPEKGVHISFLITIQEAKEIKKAVEDMVKEAHHHKREFLLDPSKKLLNPAGLILSFPVDVFRWKATRRYPLPKPSETQWNG